MGIIAGENSDLVIITSDNPRSEDPLSIIRHIEEGIQKAGMNRVELPSPVRGSGYYIEADRQKAIGMGISMAGKNDLVLIAGKGHEDYQIVGEEKRFFDDRKEAAIAASQMSH